MNVPFSFVLARSGERNVLVDCGFMNEGGGAEMAIRFDVPWWVSPVKMLAEFGVPADDVSDIVLSHAHFDHMGSIGEFPKARAPHPEARIPLLDGGDGAAAAIRLHHRRSSTPTISAPPSTPRSSTG